MTEPIIRVEGVSKRYVLSHQGENRPTSFREVIADKVGSAFRHLVTAGRAGTRRTDEEFWALKDVTFDVKPGEVVGFVGRNGAGKSTLLKVLSRITEPTSGRIVLRGRVASLLEVGTGFHPELSGRENIFLNGAILGMSKVEIKRHFDAIVAFAEVERFLDTPVKRYSSGMYVRLAFAVAAHLEPEILIVDEVLAVGDTQFQKKCLGKMEEVRGQGRTVLFVSHNMGMVKRLCNKAVMLHKGVVTSAGGVDEVLSHYLSAGVTYTGAWSRSQPVPDAPGLYFREISVRTAADEITGQVGTTSPFQVVLRVVATKAQDGAQLAIRFTNQEQIHVFTVSSTDEAHGYVPIEEGEHEYRIQVPAEFLMPGVYTLNLVSHAPFVRLFESVEDELALTVEDTGGHATCCGFTPAGLVTPVFPWRHSKVDRGSTAASARS